MPALAAKSTNLRVGLWMFVATVTGLVACISASSNHPGLGDPFAAGAEAQRAQIDSRLCPQHRDCVCGVRAVARRGLALHRLGPGSRGDRSWVSLHTRKLGSLAAPASTRTYVWPGCGGLDTVPVRLRRRGVLGEKRARIRRRATPRRIGLALAGGRGGGLFQSSSRTLDRSAAISVATDGRCYGATLGVLAVATLLYLDRSTDFIYFRF